MPELKVNGKSHVFEESDFPKNLGALVDHLEVNRKAVVADIDGDIIAQDEFDAYELMPDTAVELVQFVGGG